MELDRRSNTILQLVVEAYIHHAQPVSSSAVARLRPELGLSSATIRAVMADLEASGLLHQPHTSAGRVPTERGLRTYVDNLVSPKLRPWDRTRLEATAANTDYAAFPAQLGQTLSGLSGQVAVVVVPRFLGSRFREVGLVRCGTGRFLAYFVSPHGLIQQKLVEVDFDLSQDDLQRIQNFLNDRLRDRSLDEVRLLLQEELRQAREVSDVLRAQALEIGQHVLPELELEVLVEGASHLLDQPEFADLHKLRTLLKTIEEKETLLRLLDHLLDNAGVKVMLGSEHPLRAIPDLACVGSAWTARSGDRTAIGLLGPTRMDYGRLVPLVQYASELFGRFWEQI
jgi:heat-inducible transcriptional repressor